MLHKKNIFVSVLGLVLGICTACGASKQTEITNLKTNQFYIGVRSAKDPNIDKYMGKKVKMRFSSMCESKTGFCNHCFGNLPYRLGIRNIGQAMAMIASKVKNLSMKSFHQSNVKLAEIDLDKAFPD